MVAQKCPVCDSKLSEAARSFHDGSTAYNCVRCGSFILSELLTTTISARLKREKDGPAKVSHHLRAQFESKNPPRYPKSLIVNQVPAFLDENTLDKILDNPLPTPHEQGDLFILWLADHTSGLGIPTAIHWERHGSIFGVMDPNGFGFVISHLLETELLKGELGIEEASVTPSFKGWDYIDSLRRGKGIHGKALMAMDFKKETIHKMYLDAFKPAAKKAGFDLFRLDENPKAGNINNRLITEIQTSVFLVADLTHHNNGAYWEAGYAEGLGKKVFYTCEKNVFKKGTHFDVNHHQTVIWEKDNPHGAEEDLKAAIRATFPSWAKQQDD